MRELAARGGWTLREDYAARVAEATASLEGRGFRGAPLALVLGSGLGNVVDRMQVEAACDFAEIPGFHAPSVLAHSGRLLQATHEGHRVLVLQGRLHAYEGIGLEEVVFPVATLLGLGARRVLLTNAAGGLDPDMRPGDLMAISGVVDLHLQDPLRGLVLPPPSTDPELQLRGATHRRFFGARLAMQLVDLAAAQGVAMRSGSYASLWGPNYETPVEIGLLRRFGLSAVGMSTGPEAALAHALGAELCGISCITNVAVEAGGQVVTHDEVIEVGAARREELATVLLAALGPLTP